VNQPAERPEYGRVHGPGDRHDRLPEKPERHDDEDRDDPGRPGEASGRLVLVALSAPLRTLHGHDRSTLTRFEPFTGHALFTPGTLDYEFRSALRGLVLGKKVTATRAEGARIVKQGLALTRHPDDLTGERTWDLRGSFTAYDATYVALAELLDCPLVTTDAKIAREVKTVQVDLH
jgi:predicted nucleic acid-binding protein